MSSPQNSIDYAIELVQAGKIQEARAVLKSLYQAEKDNPQYWVAVTMADQSEEQAAEHIEQAIELERPGVQGGNGGGDAPPPPEFDDGPSDLSPPPRRWGVLLGAAAVLLVVLALVVLWGGSPDSPLGRLLGGPGTPVAEEAGGAPAGAEEAVTPTVTLTPTITLTPTVTPTPTITPTPTNSPTPTPAGPVLWSADVETGDLSQWEVEVYPDTGWPLGGVWLSGAGTAEVSNEVAHSGDYSVALTVDGDGGARMARRSLWNDPNLPDDAYYSVWYYFPYAFQVYDYQNAFQWKRAFYLEDGTGTSEPVYSVNIDDRPDGSIYFLLNDKVGEDGGYKTDGWGNRAEATINIPVGQWVHLECRYRWSTEPDGLVQCWQDGVELWRVEDVITDFDFGWIEHPRQWSVNNYSDGMNPRQVTFYIDDPAISEERLGPSYTATAQTD